MASPISSLLGSSASSGTNASSANGAANPAAPPSEEMFLQLLVSQIQNQDPLNPTDSTQFVSQLAQFSELEQVVAIRGDIETAMGSGAQQNASNSSGTSATGTSTDSTNLPPSTGTSGTSNDSTGTSAN